MKICSIAEKHSADELITGCVDFLLKNSSPFFSDEKTVEVRIMLVA